MMSHTTEKTLQDFKDEVARENKPHFDYVSEYINKEFTNWDNAINRNPPFSLLMKMLTEAAERYARHMAAKAWQDGYVCGFWDGKSDEDYMHERTNPYKQ